LRRDTSARNHPNIPANHSIEQQQRQHFLVMDLSGEQTLAQRNGRQSLEMERLLPLAIQIADAAGRRTARESSTGASSSANIFLNLTARTRRARRE
jgi:hypothetical protein